MIGNVRTKATVVRKVMKFTFTDSKWNDYYKINFARANKHDIWTIQFLFPDVSFTWEYIIKNSLTIQGFP